MSKPIIEIGAPVTLIPRLGQRHAQEIETPSGSR